MPGKHSRNNQNNYGGKKSKTRHRRLPAAGGNIPNTIPRGSRLSALAAGGSAPNHQGWGWQAPILGIPNPFTIQHPAAAGPTPFHMQPAAGGYIPDTIPRGRQLSAPAAGGHIPDTIPRGRQLSALAAGGAGPNNQGLGWRAPILGIPNPFTMPSAAAGPTPFRIRSQRSASAERKSRQNKKHGKKD